MIDLRRRSISFEMGGTWYLVTFISRPFGRVSDVTVSQSKKRSGFYYPCDAKIDLKNITAVGALKEFWRSIERDAIAALQRIFRHW